MDNPGAIRRLERPLVELARRGHRVHVAYGEVRKPDAIVAMHRLALEHPGLTFAPCPRADMTDWAPLVAQLRGTLDYAYYLEPGAPRGTWLAARARKRAHRGVARVLDRAARTRGPLVSVIRYLEQCVDPPRAVREWLADEQPDVVAVTRLVGIASAEAEIVHAALDARLPVAFPVLSWDNLTGKGLVRDAPDRALVWNDAQSAELQAAHRVPADRITVVGAPEYDDWGPRQPGGSPRDEWCARLGIDPSRPLVLYVASSASIAGDESIAFRQWLDATRAARRALGAVVVARPHPQNARHWQALVAPTGEVVVWPPMGADPIDPARRPDHLDSLRHAAAVVGINTTMMVEAALFGAPVLTFRTPLTERGQGGTGHFHHLPREHGGHVLVGESLEEHARQLGSVVGADASAVNDAFATRFLRPHGPSGSTAAFVAALESLATAGPAGHRQARSGARAARMVVERHGRRTAPHPVLKAVARERRLARVAAERRGASNLEVARILAGDGPVIVGPFDAEVGHELVYWIPFLRRLVEDEPGLRERFVIISRGGVESWYAGIGDRYLDIFDLLPADEALALAAASVAERGGRRRQLRVTAGDRRLVGLACERLGLTGVAHLHPSAGVEPAPSEIRLEPRALHALPFSYRAVAPPPLPPGITLPDRFVAVRLYASRALPDTSEHREMIRRIVEHVEGAAPIVVVESGRRYDDHAGFVVEPRGAGMIVQAVEPRTNLALQSAILGRATAVVGTYGGMGALLASTLGRPAIALHAPGMTRIQEDMFALLHRIAREPGFGSLLTLGIDRIEDVVPALRARGALTPSVAPTGRSVSR